MLESPATATASISIACQINILRTRNNGKPSIQSSPPLHNSPLRLQRPNPYRRTPKAHPAHPPPNLNHQFPEHQLRLPLPKPKRESPVSGRGTLTYLIFAREVHNYPIPCHPRFPRDALPNSAPLATFIGSQEAGKSTRTYKSRGLRYPAPPKFPQIGRAHV